MKSSTVFSRFIIVLFPLIPFVLFAKEDTMLLKIGSQAPAFSLVSSNGDTVSLKDFAGTSNVVLIFYPGDQTPGCTAQLCAIRDDYKEFEAKNAKVFGVNPADMLSHKKFVEKQKYRFPLLVDENKMVTKLYGCEGWPMVKRTVYVIDTAGKIIFARRGRPGNEEILKAIPGK
jgi:peroxiredoxin Q/BCP